MRIPIRRVEKPWGYELIFAHTDRYVGKILHVERRARRCRCSTTSSRTRPSTWPRARSSCWWRRTATWSRPTLRGGESYRIRPFTRHRMIAGENGCDIIEVSTPELDDVVRLEDRYGRA